MIKTKWQYLKLLFKLHYYQYNNKKLKIIVGGAGTKFNGWINTDINILDITSSSNWQQLFKTNDLSNILAEHVWEHLTKDESKKALDNCFKFLKKGGRLRIAVPDGYFPDKDYINYVKPGGHGPGSDDHKILYTYVKLSNELEGAGFSIQLVEYFDESGRFWKNKWSVEEGFIHRSFDFDKRNKKEVKYTSLIIDGIKK